MLPPVRLLTVCAVAEPGGAEQAAVRILRELAPRGWAPTLTSPGPGGVRDAARAEGWGWRRLDAGGLGAGGAAAGASRFAGALRARDAARAVASWPKAAREAARSDVVLVNGTVAARLLPAVAATRARTALYVHDVVDRVPRHWHRADVVLAASGAVARALESNGLRAHVVYAPIDLDPPPADPPWPRDPERPVVGFVGRLEPRKAPLDLVAAAPRIRARVPGARIVIVGDDPYGTDSDYLARVRCAPEVESYGWRPDAAGLMRHMDVLVAPSLREPFGTVLSEAMAVGTPVVATRVDGLPEVVTDGVDGALVPPSDPPALADAVVRVLARRDELGAAAARSARRFAAPAVATRVEELLRG